MTDDPPTPEGVPPTERFLIFLDFYLSGYILENLLLNT